MKIYLDACTLNRLTDDQTQQRVRGEAEAIEHILRLIGERRIEWTASTVLASELSRNPDSGRREDALKLLARAGSLMRPSQAAVERAEFLAAAGYGEFDAFHLSCAEETGASVLLTTDDRFIRQSARQLGDPAVQVVNPVDWLMETSAWFPRNR